MRSGGVAIHRSCRLSKYISGGGYRFPKKEEKKKTKRPMWTSRIIEDKYKRHSVASPLSSYASLYWLIEDGKKKRVRVRERHIRASCVKLRYWFSDNNKTSIKCLKHSRRYPNISSFWWQPTGCWLVLTGNHSIKAHGLPFRWHYPRTSEIGKVYYIASGFFYDIGLFDQMPRGCFFGISETRSFALEGNIG